MTRRSIAVVLLLISVATACGGDSDAGLATSDSDAAVATYQYTIPIGAGEAIDAGEPLEILPRTLTAIVGETISIVNDDDRGHTVGPWFVGAHETVRQEFTSAGSFAGTCTVHPSGEFILEVLEA